MCRYHFLTKACPIVIEAKQFSLSELQFHRRRGDHLVNEASILPIVQKHNIG